MDNITIEGSCDCPMECNSISYSFSVVSTPFDPELLCRDDVNDYNIGNGKSDFLMKPFYKRKAPPQFERRLLKMMNNISEDAMAYCKKNIKYRAEVIFKMATDSMSVTTMSRRLSFFDKMSAFGKEFLLPLLYSNSFVMLFLCYRWNFGIIHWNQYPQYDRSYILDCQIFG